MVKPAAVMTPEVVSSPSFLRKLSGIRLTPIVVVDMSVPFASVARSTLARDETAKFVVVADVEVESVNTAVSGVVAPIAVLLIVPPEMVRASAISESIQSNDRVPEFCNAPLSIEPLLEIVRSSATSESAQSNDSVPEFASSSFSIAVPKSAVTLPPEYVSPEEKVVVACHEGTPETSASTCPSVPAVVVAIADVPLPNSMVLATIAACPVPPLLTPRIPVMSDAKSMSAVAMEPAVALRNPERFAIDRFDVNRLVELAVVEKRFVVVAFVVVEFVVIRLMMVEDAVETKPPVKARIVEVETAVDPNCDAESNGKTPLPLESS